MSTNRKTAIIVGILFIIGTAAGILGGVVTGPTLNDPDYLALVSANQTQMVVGVLLILVMGFALVMVPVMLYPLFKKHNEALALGAVVFRGALEGVAYMLLAIAWLVLLSVSKEFVMAGTPDASNYQTWGSLLVAAFDWIEQILAIVFSLGALMIYAVFYQSRLIPRWLSIWGIAGGAVYLAVPVLFLFGVDVEFRVIPLGVQEMILALWLIIKGFSPGAVADAPVRLRAGASEA